jgi:hypothetical protein
MNQDQMNSLMDEFFATNSYNRQDDWRKTPATDDDPDDEPDVVTKYSDDQPRDDHGRWSDTGGGEGTSPPAGIDSVVGVQLGPDGTKYPKAHYEEMKRVAKEELVKAGMEGQIVEFRTGPGEEIPGLPGFREAGHFRAGVRGTGIIQINLDEIGGTADGVISPGLRQLVRHEASHSRFDYALTRGPLVDSGDTEVGRFLRENEARLEKEDGTTAYSKAWWKRAEDIGAGRISVHPSVLYRRQAVNESLAEMHAQYPFISFAPPTYRKLDALVEAAWAKRKIPA